MASIVTETLFGSATGRGLDGEGGNCQSPSRSRYRSMFGLAADDSNGKGERGRAIDPGPPRTNAGHTVMDPAIASAAGDSLRRGVDSGGDDQVRWRVVGPNDAHRGFRMFDGILMSVKDVSSEELFLERMRIAYSAYDAYVAGLADGSPLEITRGLVEAVSACLVKYFSTQSALRANRPFIAKVLRLESADLFCSHSDFMRSFLFTNASPEDEAVISLAEKVYAENDFDVCGETGAGRSGADDLTGSGGADETVTSLTDRLFDFGMRIAERSVVGGTSASLGPRDATSHFATLSDELPFQRRRKDGAATAMLIVVTDFEALHNYVAYVLYLTPTQLTRRYDVNFDCMRRPQSEAGAECCRAREASKKRAGDDTKVVIRAVIEKKRREKIDSMAERSAACEATLRQLAARTSRRNGDLLRHVLLMLFDKCLTEIIDKGFENLNRRRGYAVNSAKEIGAATIYTGIVDTVGEVSARVEGHAFDRVAEGGGDKTAQSANNDADARPHLRFSLPLSTIVTEVTNRRNGGGGGDSARERPARDRYDVGDGGE